MGDIMTLIDRVQQDMLAAMKAHEEARLSALRMIKAALMKQKVDSPKPLDETAEMQVLTSLIKQRMDAAEMYRKAGRVEQADKEEAEKAIIENYLPAGASEAEIDAAIAEALAETGVTSVKQMGVVMKATQAKLKGKTVDGKALSRQSTRETLNGSLASNTPRASFSPKARIDQDSFRHIQLNRTDALDTKDIHVTDRQRRS